jgi:SAM-dependent methyltransferase
MKFIKPDKSIIETASPYIGPYSNPILRAIYYDKLKRVFNYLKDRRWELILEIGCGEGFLLPSLCQISEKVIGSDIKETLEFSKKITLNEIKEKCANLELKEIDARYLSSVIDKESCDVIVAISVLEHIPEYKITIEEIKTCLKPKGILVCVVPTENSLYKIGRRILRYHNEYHKGYAFKELRPSLSKNFHEVKTWFSPFHLPLFFSGVYQKSQNIMYKGSLYEHPLNPS